MHMASDTHIPGMNDPFSPVQTEANELHEMFECYLNSGFKREEAIQLLCAILAYGRQKEIIERLDAIREFTEQSEWVEEETEDDE